jgi:hypothetical protein
LNEARFDGRVGFLFFVKVRERGVGGAKWSSVFLDVVNVLWILAVYEVAEQGVKFEAGFGNGVSSGYDLFFVEAGRELLDTWSCVAISGERGRVRIGEEFEGLIFVEVGDSEALECVIANIFIFLSQSGFVGRAISSLEAAEVEIW